MSRQGLALIAFGLGIVMAPLGWVLTTNITTTAIAQEGGNEDLIDIQPGERRQSKKSVDKPRQAQDQGLAAIEPVEDQPSPVAVYLDLAKQKAELLTPEELAHETQVLRQELLELQATLKLRTAEQQLQQLIDEHPESGAAKRARMLLDVLRNPRTNSTFWSPEQLRPESEDGFESVQQRKRVRRVDADDFAPNGNDDPFTSPPVRQNAQPAQPTKKPVPSPNPDRS